MKLKKIFLFAFLVTALSGLSSQAMDDVESSDNTTAQRFALVQKVEDCFDRGDRVSALANTPNQARKIEYLNLALKEIDDALELIASDFSLTDTDGEALAVRAYCRQGAIIEQSLEQCSHPGCSCQNEKMQRAAKSYFKACLASVDQETFRSKIGSVKPAVAIILNGFDAVYSELVEGTGLTHTGIKTRFDRFEARFPEERLRGPVDELSALLARIEGQPEFRGRFSTDMFSQMRGRRALRFGPPLGERSTVRATVVMMMPRRQNPFDDGSGMPFGLNGMSAASIEQLTYRQQQAASQNPTGTREIHVSLSGLEQLIRQLEGNSTGF